MTELHNTIMGRRLIEHDIPEIHTQLKRIADVLEAKEKHPAIEFLEELEAITKDRDTANRIRKFLYKEKIWNKEINLEK
jgi:hypothetical protein